MSRAIILEDGERKEYDKVGIEEGFAIGATRHSTFEHPGSDASRLKRFVYYVNAISFGMYGMDHYYETEAFPMTQVERVEGVK